MSNNRIVTGVLSRPMKNDITSPTAESTPRIEVAINPIVAAASCV
jgi:hypothetical protein